MPASYFTDIIKAINVIAEASRVEKTLHVDDEKLFRLILDRLNIPVMDEDAGFKLRVAYVLP